MGGRVPFLFKAVPAPDGKRRRLQPDEQEAAVVRQIFGWAVDGIGALGIALQLNKDGLTMRGRRWSKGTA